MAKRKLAKGWTKDRWDEFCLLRQLLFLIESLDDGNRHLQKTAAAIQSARKLIETNRSGKRFRFSFISFLEQLAQGD